MTVENNSTTDRRSKLCKTKRHILTDKKGMPLSVVMSSASTRDIKLVIDVVDDSVIKQQLQRQRQLPSHKPKLGIRGRL